MVVPYSGIERTADRGVKKTSTGDLPLSCKHSTYINMARSRNGYALAHAPKIPSL